MERNIQNFYLCKFYRASVEYKLVTATTFDREERAEHHLTVVCRDHGLPVALTSTREIKVTVLDVNDNSPVLDSENYWVTVHENNNPGNELFRVNATDADCCLNAELIFDLQPLSGTSTSEALAIDRTSGQVSTQISFDYESEPREFAYLLTVFDRGDTPRSATATLRVSVADINDNKPRFERSAYYITTAENQPIGSSVGEVNATDRDVTAQFNRVYYDILRSTVAGGGHATNDADAFSIDKYTGIIRTVKRLNREHQALYVFTVTASNDVSTVVSRDHSDLTDFADVTVYVDDVNDNRPVFVFPGPHRGRHVHLPPRYLVSTDYS